MVNTDPAIGRAYGFMLFCQVGRTFLNLDYLRLGTLGRGKLVDDLGPSQFDSLVKILSLPSSAKDYRFLLTLTNLWEVFDQPEEFTIPKVLYFNFKISGYTRARSVSNQPFVPHSGGVRGLSGV